MVVTTTSITAVSVSMRSAHSTLRSPEAIQVMIGMRTSRPKPTLTKAIHDRIMAKNKRVVVVSAAMRERRRGGVGGFRMRYGGMCPGRGRAAGMAGASAGECNQARQDRTKQRQEDDRLIHARVQPFIR